MTKTTTADPILGRMPPGPILLPSLYLPSGDINGNAIAYYRHAHGLNQAEFGEIIGANQQQVSNWERGKVQPGKTSHTRIYQFVQATGLLLQKYNGIIPANLQAGTIFMGEDGDDALGAMIRAVDSAAEEAAELARKQAMLKEQAVEALTTVSEQLATAHRLVENTIRRVEKEW